MNRLLVLAALSTSLVMSASLSYGQELETFDSPNQTQTGNGNFVFHNGISPAWVSPAGSITPNPTNVEIVSTGGYGTAYHDFYSQDTPNVVSIAGSSVLQLDVTINSGDIGPFVDLQDGEGDQWQYFYGYGLIGSGNAPAQEPGETITELGNNELLLDVPLNAPHSNGGSPTFDFSQIVNFRLEDDPGSNPNYDISFNDLSGVNLPEPAGVGIGAVACLLAARRRRR